MPSNNRLRGVIPPLVTPLVGRDALDVDGLERLIEHVLAGGVSGVFVLGSTGEAPSLSHRLRQEVVVRTCRIVNDRVPVLVGITDTSFVESINLACQAAEAGAAAVVTSAPYYFPAGQPELAEYCQHLVKELSLPLFLYNMPSLTKVSFEPETVAQLMEDERIAGIKDSSGDMNYFRRLLELKRRRDDWTVLIGPEELLSEAVRLGGDGGVHGGANLYPHLLVNLYEAVVDRISDNAKAKRVQDLSNELERLHQLFRVGRHPSAIIKGIKCALSLLSICDDYMAEPFHRFREREREQIRSILLETGLLTGLG